MLSHRDFPAESAQSCPLMQPAQFARYKRYENGRDEVALPGDSILFEEALKNSRDCLYLT
jgi:hypothetical protein